MKLLNLNPTPEIGASSWLLELDGHRLLLDAGVHPKLDGHAALPLFSAVKDPIDAIAITHCHHDHVGSLPVAMRHFPDAHVLLTELSYFLVERVLHNSVNVMTRQRDEAGIKEYPFFTHDELDEIAPRFQGFRYNREVEWAAFRKQRRGMVSPTLEFYDAGHALGSAGIMVRGDHESLFYTGDVSFHDQTILRSARFEDVEADVLLMETTRGNHAVPAGFTREREVERFAEELLKAQARGASVLIPAFALGRTQEILAMLAVLILEGRLKPQPIYIGGLGRVFTEIYDLQSHRTHRQHSTMQLRETLNLQVLERRQLETLPLSGGHIFVLTAGMMTEHTAAHDLALRFLADPKQAIFFVGYADPDTPAGHLRAAKPGESFLFSPAAGNVTAQCELHNFDLTAHANRNDLLEFVGQVSPRTVVLCHGDQSAQQWFADQIRSRWPKIKILHPGPKEQVEC